jgi:predicted HicB family RNase H-like nuclease
VAVTAKFTAQIVVMVEPSVKEKLVELADAQGTSYGDVVRELLTEALEHRSAEVSDL